MSITNCKITRAERLRTPNTIFFSGVEDIKLRFFYKTCDTKIITYLTQCNKDNTHVSMFIKTLIRANLQILKHSVPSD